MTDIVVTWPKNRPLGSYIAELELAKRDGKIINFRLPNPPSMGTVVSEDEDQRCFRVHDGRVRGWVTVLGAQWRGRNEVARVQHGRTVGHWPPGYYLICDPEWHEIPREKQLVMPGFRGFRYFDRTTVE